MPGRNANTATYRNGFNGMEKDDELKGSGNTYDFGARIYDSRLGRWLTVDPEFGLQPGWSTYKFALDNPIIFIDPEGETEFYSIKGKWIGTDGVDNNVVALVTDRKIKRAIKKATCKGLTYEAQSINKAAEKKNGMLLINKDVLSYSFNMLVKSLSKKGKVGEFAGSMTKKGAHYKPVEEEMRYAEGTGNAIPSEGDISIHSHPTGKLSEQGEFVQADQPTKDKPGNPGDESAFKKYDTNIIVGRNGVIVNQENEAGGKYLDESEREDAINVYGSDFKKRIGVLSGDQAEAMLKGRNISKRGREYNKKVNSQPKP